MNTIKNIDTNLDRIAKLDAKLNRIANPLADTQFQKIFHDYSELTATVSQLQRSFEPVIKGIEPLLQNESLLALSRSCQALADQFAAYQQLYSGIEASVAALEPVLRVQRELYSAFTPAYFSEMHRLFENTQRAMSSLHLPSTLVSEELSADFLESIDLVKPFLDKEQDSEYEEFFDIPTENTASVAPPVQKRLTFEQCIDWIIRIIAILSFFYERLPDEQTAELIELQKVENKIAADQLIVEQEHRELTQEQNDLLKQVLELMESLNDEIEALPMDGDEPLDQVDTLNEDKHLIIDQSESPKDTDAQNNDNTELKGQ